MKIDSDIVSEYKNNYSYSIYIDKITYHPELFNAAIISFTN